MRARCCISGMLGGDGRSRRFYRGSGMVWDVCDVLPTRPTFGSGAAPRGKMIVRPHVFVAGILWGACDGRSAIFHSELSSLDQQEIVVRDHNTLWLEVYMLREVTKTMYVYL